MRVEPHRYGQALLLAVSGGVDSVVMAELMLHFAAASGLRPGVRLAIAHCNFHLRGAESDRDEAFVREFAVKKGLECFVAQFDTEAYSREHSVSVEMAARDLRYTFFDELCREHGFAGTCVAHNANDNAETLVLNLVRGTGLRGACAMSEVSANPCGTSLIFRPLLPYTRARIEEYACKWGIEWCEDSTNAQTEARRNVVRNVVFPVLEQLNPSLVETLNSDIAHFCQVRQIVEEAVPALDFAKGVRIEDLKALPFMEYAVFEALSRYSFNPSVIEDLIGLLKGDRIISGKTFESEDWKIITTTERLLLERRGDVLPAAQVKVEVLEWDSSRSPVTVRGVTLLDAAAFLSEPVIREWRAGDYLRPPGMRGRKKVSDILTDLKYSISEKKRVMVVAGEGSHVLAVVGERVDACAAVTPSTRRVYRISIE